MVNSVDWYLLGVLLYEMLVGIPPYYDNDRDVLFYNIIHEDLEIPSYISKTARDLIVRLMDRNPITRLGSNGADEVKGHKWFKGINWNDVINKKLDPPLPYLKRKVKKGEGQIIIEHPLDFDKNKTNLESDPNYIPGWSFVQ
jgi:serine/threonine protein kinase